MSAVSLTAVVRKSLTAKAMGILAAIALLAHGVYAQNIAGT